MKDKSTIEKAEYQEQFEMGWDSVDTGATNPYYSSSNCGEAFRLGAFARSLGFQRTLADAVRKSRGSTWFVGATKFDAGNGVRVVSSHPITPAQHNAFPNGRWS